MIMNKNEKLKRLEEVLNEKMFIINLAGESIRVSFNQLQDLYEALMPLIKEGKKVVDKITQETLNIKTYVN